MTSDEVAREIERLERLLLDPAFRAGADGLASFLDPDFVEVGASGEVYTRAEVLNGVAREGMIVREMSDFRAWPLGSEVVLVSYRLARRDGEGVVVHSVRSSVWRLDPAAGAWRMVFHQGTAANTRM